ncbi:oxidoreductase [Laribacter hongkongensis]|uniref:SDR family NAD(P)-dependent oxidoreductase n=1 Tax=Laribacter hongkongensis TaxID=168471 RepID=UPI0018784C40|nr:SDR family oxidoreductase [Laribacter hongkongensis]MBE5528323.1 oxidoreductase [Laribacter hongkongensis]
MQLQLQGKSVLVTGSSKGIGRAIAEAFLAEGAQVAFNGRDADVLERIVAAQTAGPAVAIDGDVSNPEQAHEVVRRVLQAFGKLDVLVCNVGSGRSVPPGAESNAEWQRVFALNLWSATNMVEAGWQALASSAGAIICISSICGQETVVGAPVTYSAAKAALNAYVRGIARPLGKDRIRINAIAPGNILFEGSVWQRKLNEDAAAVERMLVRDVALAKLGTTQDVANLALWLASPAASFCTGSIFVADGGQVHS